MMATIIYKKKKGREYAYWVRSARVGGKPRIVEQVYLGPKGRFLEEVKAAYTRERSPGPTSTEAGRDQGVRGHRLSVALGGRVGAARDRGSSRPASFRPV